VTIGTARKRRACGVSVGKRSPRKFEKSKNDLYDTPLKGVLPLLPFLAPNTPFIEPCFGNGYLAEHLQANGHVCVGVIEADARTHSYETDGASLFITNPPWTRRFEIGRDAADKIIWEEVLHPMIENLSRQLPLWALFDADWMHTDQATDLIQTCSHIVSVGRLKWIEGTKHQGFDNYSWYRFDAEHVGGPRFIGRGQLVEKPADEIEAPSSPQPPTLDPPELHLSNAARFQRGIREISPGFTPPLQLSPGYIFS
jgi:hypothetical protein